MTLDDVLTRTAKLPDALRDVKRWIRVAVQIAEVDPEMALVRARKTVEHVLRQEWQRALPGEPIGKRMLDELLNRLRKDGHLPEHVFTFGSNVKEFGNLGAHPGADPAALPAV